MGRRRIESGVPGVAKGWLVVAVAPLVAAVALAFVTEPARAAELREERPERARAVEPVRAPPEQVESWQTASWETAPSKPRCCKICRKGCPCGDTCISCAKTCRVGPGCACSE